MQQDIASIFDRRPFQRRHFSVADETVAPIPTSTSPSHPDGPPASGDAALIAILDVPLAPGETALAGFLRKEAELRVAFASLPVLAARTLQARLSNPKPGDLLAEKFGRLTAERRHRLLTFLADARRREALAHARR